MNESYEDFIARLDGLDEMAAARALAERHGVRDVDIERVIRMEADERLQDAREVTGRRMTYANAEQKAIKSLAEWLENGAKWSVDLDLAALAGFILSHRQACTWAVLTAKAKAHVAPPDTLSALRKAATSEETHVINGVMERLGWRCAGCGDCRPGVRFVRTGGGGGGGCEDCQSRLADMLPEG